MSYYKLPINVIFSGVFSRDKQDLLDFLDEMRADPIHHGYDASKFLQTKYIPESGIEEITNGKILIDFGGPASIDGWTDIDLANDFIARIKNESIPYFNDIQKNHCGKKVGKLYEISYPNKHIYQSYFVPEDIFESFMSVDITPHLDAALEHIKKNDATISELCLRPKQIVIPLLKGSDENN